MAVPGLTIGMSVLIRTVTMTDAGTIAGLTDDFIILEKAAWIAETGRFADALKTGFFAEIEPFPGLVYVARGAIVDVCSINRPKGGYKQQ